MQGVEGRACRVTGAGGGGAGLQGDRCRTVSREGESATGPAGMETEHIA